MQNRGKTHCLKILVMRPPPVTLYAWQSNCPPQLFDAMAALEALDATVFRFVNQHLSNPVMDAIMPWFAGNALFVPALAFLAGVLVWKGGRRGRLFVVMVFTLIALGDMLVINTLKEAISRPRPFSTLTDLNLLTGRGRNESMPSSHTSTWFAAALISYVYYRRSWRVMLPLACVMAFSRVYLGAHYPSDALAGAVLGAGYAAFGLWSIQFAWQHAGPRWFPDWFRKLPSLINPSATVAAPPQDRDEKETAGRDAHWLYLGYVLIAAILLARLLYLASGKIELSEDEAYQWTWSEHLALSYYSKPPLIAYAQFLGTSIWGDNAFGVRFLSPVIAALLSFLLLRFMTREVNSRCGFWLVLILNCAPMLAAGAILMTIDPLLVLFWTTAVIAGWKAVQPTGQTRDWLWVGLWTGLAFLSKYSGLFLAGCFGLFFALQPLARSHLRRPGPYLALGIALLCTTPVLIWNAQHGWITVRHVADNANLDQQWKPTLRYFWDFVGSEAALLNPVFFVGACWAIGAIWSRERRTPLLSYLFCMGAPVFIGYWAYTFHSRVLPNWIAPAVVPMFCLMVIYWHTRWREGARAVKGWLIAGVSLGLFVVILLHDTNLVAKIAGEPLPARMDPLRRVRAWSTTAQTVERFRQRLLESEPGKDAFIICAHYGLTGEITFYLPEAKRRVTERPLVYFESTDRPKNQFHFWPHYHYRRHRVGQNAIYVREAKSQPRPPPPGLLAEFESVRELGFQDIVYRGRVMRRIELFECRNLRAPDEN